MKKIILLALSLLPLQALSEVSDAEIISNVQQIAATSKLKEILPVEGIQKADDQVFFLETLKFEDGATLGLKATNRDAIYLMAKEVRVHGGGFKARIEYYDIESQKGKDGSAPPSPQAKLTRSGGSGKNGVTGSRGKSGGEGLTRQLPTLYIVTTKITTVPEAGMPNGLSDIRIYADGIDGGEGGKGGVGQKGQQGQDGRHGKKKHGLCSKGAGNGGNGGKGGDYGLGGKGGNGGNGGNIVFVITESVVDDVKDMRIRARGGLPGLGGLHGKGGSGGDYGSRGKQPANCSGKSAGNRGQSGTSPNPNERAVDGVDEGKRGRIRYVIFDGLASIFK